MGNRSVSEVFFAFSPPVCALILSSPDALTDSVFKCPSGFVADIVTRATNQPVFLYSFERDPGFNRIDKECFRVAHAYELPFLFPAALIWMGAGYQFDQLELQLSAAMIQSWTAFAATGNPSNSMIKWAPWNAQDRPYNILNSPVVAPQSGFRADYCKVWP
jgi:carboxylesterase type B